MHIQIEAEREREMKKITATMDVVFETITGSLKCLEHVMISHTAQL